MNLLGTCFEKTGSIVTQLGAANNRVVAEQHLLALQDCLVLNQLHLGNKVTHFLIGWGKRAWPGWRIFRDGAHIGATMSGCITYCHADTGIGNAAGAIYHSIILLAHGKSASIAHGFGIAVFVVAGRESVVDPEERADLHALVGFAQHVIAVLCDFHDFARAQELLHFVSEIRKCSCFGSDAIGSFLFADDDGSASPRVTCCDDAVFGKDYHRARATNFTKDLFDAFHEVSAFDDQETDDLGLVDAS